MKKLFCFILGVALALPALGYSFNYNFYVEDIPMEIIAQDTNNNAFYAFYNIVNIGLGVNLTDNALFKFRLKDTYIGLTNISNQNQLYFDRASFSYASDQFGGLIGRDLFVEDNGILIGNLADGLRLNSGFFEMKQRLYVYYSGLLPKDVNKFNVDIYDRTNGASRLFTGLVWEKLGIIPQIRAVSLQMLYSRDMSTNNLFYPFYIGLHSDGTIINNFAYNTTILSQVGSYTNGKSLMGWGGDLDLVYMLLNLPKIGISGGVAFATGDDASTSNTYEGFYSFGRYDTGNVLNLLFSNLFLLKMGVIGKFLDDNLSVKLGYAYISRISTNDVVNGLDGKGSLVGNEISAIVSYSFDPNFGVFLSAGYLIGGDARLNKTNDYKVIGGVDVKL